MKIIDSHQHFWQFDPERDEWITEEMMAIRRDFLPEDLILATQNLGIEGSIAVQADQSEDETRFLLQLADQNPFIKGVVGWLDLEDFRLDLNLERFTANKKLVGLRHIVQAEPEDDFFQRGPFQSGIETLKYHNLTYDILIYPRQLKSAIEMAKRFPNQLFVIDHLAKPSIKNQQFGEWEKDIRTIATFENVYCKVSGMVTEADLKNWKYTDFTPYLDIIVEGFGTKRIMYGSDWPVCLLAASYQQTLEIVKTYFSSFSAAEQNAIFYKNAKRFYKIKA